MAAQTGPLPYPSHSHRDIGALSERVQALMGQVMQLSKVRLIDYETKNGDGSALVEPKPNWRASFMDVAAATDEKPPAEQKVAVREAAEELAKQVKADDKTAALETVGFSKALEEKGSGFRATIAATRPSEDEIRKQVEEFEAAMNG